MSLKKCPSCSGQVSGSANACPHCGDNLAARRSWWWALAIVVAVGSSGLVAMTNRPAAPEVVQTAAPVDPVRKPQLADAKKIRPDQLKNIPSDYQIDVAQMVNLLRQKHPRCRESLNPLNVALAAKQDNAANPSYFAQCGTGPKPAILYFTWMDAVNRVMPVQPAPTPTVDQRAAADQCELEAKKRASIPATVDFSRVWHSSFQAHDDGTAVYLTRFTAKNAFGVGHAYQVRCLFKGFALTSASVSPSD
ncbi:hypothetical protein [Stutzerimonas nitrititolerans]|uniref:hypothetical protein n=1 Tax=Stutzerimonas nitrititolerans TaxID=2482751 RepID=UPI0028A884DB|nr:hypothetical protein [Stutzerimonas nitrititolerans]